jgi:diguanylate cyclase (GGDEF)-like protein/PAS domain S-box-containing protein
MPRARAFDPFSGRGRRSVAAILCTFALSSALSVGLSIWSTSGSRHQAAVVQVAARQRTLAERYIEEVLIARQGDSADPAAIAQKLRRSADALLDGGVAPAIDGDDDATRLSRARGSVVRRQLEQARRLVADLTATGSALLRGEPVTAVRPTAHERLPDQPLQRLRVLTALTSNVSLNAARTIAGADDRNIDHLISLQAGLGIGGLLMSLLLAWALIRATRRQTAHFRSLVTSSTDLVLVFGRDGCRYASASVSRTTGRPEKELLGDGIFAVFPEDDQPSIRAASIHGEPHELVARVSDGSGGWRQLETHVSDLRGDRHVRGIVFNARDITERLELEEQLTRQAFHDDLTDLPNRALFRDRLDHALTRAKRSGELLSVLLIDLDGFKQVNDSLGHDAGDKLIQEVGRRFAGSVRTSDTVARLGGDEYAILLEEADGRRAVHTGDRLLAVLREPVSIAGRELVLSASIGIVTVSGGSATGEEVIRDADIAMYAAKEGGRGRHEVFHDEMARELGELLGIEHELRLALERGELSLHYQPMVELASARAAVVGIEALLRWRSPTRGNVPPGRFIAVAERTGLIVDLGEFVLREACTQAAAWRRELFLEELPVTWVNVSAKQLVAGFNQRVVEILAAAGLSPDCLGIEITESAIVESGINGVRARAELEALHRIGVLIAIDDFGTGFSSLGQLRQFPIDVIKVDRSFVQGAETDSKDATITSNLISLAHALDIVAVAEGIESNAQLDALRGFGCDQAQGFLFAHPAPADEVGKLLVRSSIEPDETAAVA